MTAGATAWETNAVSQISDLAVEAGELAHTYFRDPERASIESKGPLDLVTAADRHVEEFISSSLRAAFPEDGIFGEEGASVESRSGRTWVVDPIDGTFNFVRGGSQWAVSIGLHEEKRPLLGAIFAPVTRELLTGGRNVAPTLNGRTLPALKPFSAEVASLSVGLGGKHVPDARRAETFQFLTSRSGAKIRICNSATISLLEVATGQSDGYLALGDASWDVMAGLPILESLGATSTLSWDRLTLRDRLQFCVGKPELLEIIADLMR